MAVHKYVTISGTVYFHFALNDTSGSGADGSAPLFDVRLCGAAANAAPVLSGTPTGPLSHANYPDGCYEISIAATVGNGFADGSSYAVFCNATVSGQNPTGFVGSFDIQPVISDMRLIQGATFTPLSGPLKVTKNAALAAFPFPMFSSAGSLLSGLSVVAQRSLDGAAFASCANAATEIGSSGWYSISLAATDTNADTIALWFSATTAAPTTITIITQPS